MLEERDSLRGQSGRDVGRIVHSSIVVPAPDHTDIVGMIQGQRFVSVRRGRDRYRY
jgi:hypothetical protein